MHIRQHIPGYFDGLDPLEGDFETVWQLLAIPFVNRWNDVDLLRFSISDGNTLMAEMKNGKWWVVGFMTPPEEVAKLGLPVWDYAESLSRKHGSRLPQ